MDDVGDAPQEVATTPLSELHSTEDGHSSEWSLRVVTSDIIPYEYPWQGKTVSTRKLLVTLLSENPEEYCLGVIKQRRSPGTGNLTHP